MSRENSPMYDQGATDALEDMELDAQHDGQALGPRPPETMNGHSVKGYERMYMLGYQEHYEYRPHRCTVDCRMVRNARGRFSGAAR